MKLLTIFLMSGSIIFINSIGIAGIPVKEGMTPQELHAQIEEMKQQRKEMLREFREEQQKKEEELKKREQLIQASQPPTPAPTPVEEKPAQAKEGVEKEQPLPPAEGGWGAGKGIVPGVVTSQEQPKETEKQEKVEKEYKARRNFSFILVIVVMVATIGLLIKSMSKGKTHNKE